MRDQDRAHVLIHSVQLHARDARQIGIKPGGHAASRLLHGVKFGHRAIDSEIAPRVGYLIVVELNDDGAALAGFRVHEVANEFHGCHSFTLDTIVLMCNISRCSLQPPLSQRATQASSPSRALFKAFAAISSAPAYLAAAHGLIYDIVRKSRVAEHLDGRGEIAC